MKKIFDWNKKRSNQNRIAQIKKSGSILSSFLNEIENQKGVEAKDFFVKKIAEEIKKHKNQTVSEEDLIKHENYWVNTINSDNFNPEIHKIIKKVESEEVLKIVAKKMLEFSESDLAKMAMSDKDIDNIKENSLEDGEKTVSSEFHIQNNPAPPEYLNMLSSKKKFKSSEDANAIGISAKAVHAINPSTFIMTKPYHKAPEEESHSWVKDPITGWATMATKALFNAGKIDHLCENVSTHKIKNMPVTVHFYAPDHTEGYAVDMDEKKHINFTQLKQIATMDFLTNNLDRHGGNIMQSDDFHGKFKNLLAIDHERNFQYHRNLTTQGIDTEDLGTHDRKSLEDPVEFKDFLSSKAMNPYFLAWEESHSSKPGFSDLHSWWKDNSSSVKETFLNHVEQINDPFVRKHVTDNFLSRHSAMDKWAKAMDKDRSRLESFNCPLPEADPLIPRPRSADVIDTKNNNLSNLKKILENEDLQGLSSAIAKIATKFEKNKKKSFKLRHHLTEMFKERLEKDSWLSIINTYHHLHSHQDFMSGSGHFFGHIMADAIMDEIENRASKAVKTKNKDLMQKVKNSISYVTENNRENLSRRKTDTVLGKNRMEADRKNVSELMDYIDKKINAKEEAA